SSNPQSKSRVRVPHRPLRTWWPSRKAAGTASVPSGRVTARSFRSRRSCFTRPAGMPSWPATSGSDSHSPTRASVMGSICATHPMSHVRARSKPVLSRSPQEPPAAALTGTAGAGRRATAAGGGAVPGHEGPQPADGEPARGPRRIGRVAPPDQPLGVTVVPRVLHHPAELLRPEVRHRVVYLLAAEHVGRDHLGRV